MQNEQPISYFARTNTREPYRRFGIKQADRLHHIYVLGRTGVGKSTLLETLARQDILHRRGVAFIDVHGDTAESLRQHIAPERAQDLIYFDASDPSQPYGYNPLRRVRSDKIPLAASGLMEAFKKLWGTQAWGVRMEHALRNTLYALLEYGEATLPDVLRMLIDKAFRTSVVARIKNEQIRAFWLHEFPNYNPRYRQDAIAPIQNKTGALLADARLYRIFSAAPIDLHFRQIMDTGKILVVNLAKGKLGADSANLLGAMLVTTLSLAGLSRADVDESQRPDFHLFIDEAQALATLSVANMISELRKYHVSMVLANQHLAALEPEVRSAILGNVGTLISFRVGAEDAQVIAREFSPTFGVHDLLNLPNHQIYLKLMIDGAPSMPFSATTLRS
jgi:type IV secretory pathway TraG/TraD family ATPase VirD4